MRPQCQAIGNLTKKPTLEYTRTNNVPTVAFTVACNGGQDDEAVFLYCRAYKKAAENIAKYCDKGSAVFVVGELSQYNDEHRNMHTYLHVTRVQFVGGRKEQMPPAKDIDATPNTNDDGKPF